MDGDLFDSIPSRCFNIYFDPSPISFIGIHDGCSTSAKLHLKLGPKYWLDFRPLCKVAHVRRESPYILPGF